jgi:uncharacterized protein
MLRWHKLVPQSVKLLLVAIGILFATSVYARGVEPRWFDIKTIDLSIPGLASAFEGYRIVQLTDIHARSGVMDRQMLERVAKLANEQQPDLIALTGDYITRTPEQAGEMLQNAFSQLRANDGVVAVMGNHERGYGEDMTPIEVALHAGKAKILNNAVYSIDRQGNKLNIAGVDDVMFGLANLPKTIAQLPKTGTNILLAHEPDFGDTSAASKKFVLQLSGHSHGGQIVLPFVPRVTPPWGKKYINGLYHIGRMQLYVSPGVGTTGAPKSRFNCRPEISILVLHQVLNSDTLPQVE